MSAPDQVLVDDSGVWELDLARRELRARGMPVPIGGRAFEILAVLAQATQEVVGKDALMSRVWPGAIVEENTLQVHISAIRKALGGDRAMLKTASGRGYRLLGGWASRERPAQAERAHSESQPAAVKPSFRTNLPAPVASLVGRAFAIRHLVEVLSAYRVLTLTGPGGIGKTALALEVARRMFASAWGDAFLVDLASLSDPGLVPSAIAGVLDLRLGGEQAGADSIARAIGGRQLLLVLDNCEHLIDAVARSAETIIRACPLVTVLATSRENLRIEGEYLYRVAPLSVPTEEDQEPDVIIAQSAVQLFVDRINASHAVLSPDPDELLVVAAICRHLDGIPLAIEFAAARATTLGLKPVAARLGDRFGLLTAGRRTALPRHQTLYATLDWSYELLPEEERVLLRRAAIFPAGFTLLAAAAVVSDLSQASVLDGIANLVAKSLVTLDGPASGGRWRLLETTRAYALGKLAEQGETDRVARRSAEFLRDLFGPAAAAAHGQPNPADKAAGRREIDNVRAAIDWALSPTGDLLLGLELTAGSAPLWFRLSLMAEYRDRIERALALLQALSAPAEELEMRLQAALGHAHWYNGPDTAPQPMERAFGRALLLAERLGNTDIQLQTLWGTWAVARARGNHQAALGAASRYQAIANRAEEKPLVIFAERLLALTHHDLGDQKRARWHVENVLSRAPHLDSQSNVDMQVDAHVAMLTILARIQWLQGLPDQAVATAQEAIDAAVRMDHWFSISYVLFTAGCPTSLWVGDIAEAQLRVDWLRERNAGDAGVVAYARIYSAVVRLRQGSAEDALIAFYIEPRVQYSLIPALSEWVSSATISVPLPDDIRSDAPWSLPEVLRVDAELLLWRGGPDAVSAADAKLQRSLELAREQSALSWELRSALSLARLRMGQDRPSDAVRLLAPVYERFTEGFETLDLRAARAMLQLLQ